MDQSVEKIYKSLYKLLGLHRQLLDNVRLEKEALVQADLKGIQDSSFAKQALIEGIRGTEVERVRATSEIAILWKRPLKELTLPNLVVAIQGSDPKGAELLRSTFNALTILIKRITEQNLDNQALVTKSLEHVQEMKNNVLGQTVPKSGTYGPQGQKTSNSHGARLISKEA